MAKYVVRKTYFLKRGSTTLGGGSVVDLTEKEYEEFKHILDPVVLPKPDAIPSVVSEGSKETQEKEGAGGKDPADTSSEGEEKDVAMSTTKNRAILRPAVRKKTK